MESYRPPTARAPMLCRTIGREDTRPRLPHISNECVAVHTSCLRAIATLMCTRILNKDGLRIHIVQLQR
jgi:hypothetical protein